MLTENGKGASCPTPALWYFGLPIRIYHQLGAIRFGPPYERHEKVQTNQESHKKIQIKRCY